MLEKESRQTCFLAACGSYSHMGSLRSTNHNPSDRRKLYYFLTAKGIDLAPVRKGNRPLGNMVFG